jgi:hypothetical protein
LSIDPDVATTNQPYVFTNDDPLNAEDPLGLVYFEMGNIDESGGAPSNFGGVDDLGGGGEGERGGGAPVPNGSRFSSQRIGAEGTKTMSKTLMHSEGFRIDVENPKPGFRNGQIHLQDSSGAKYQYNFDTGEFEGVSNTFARELARNPAVKLAIKKGLALLGMK